MIMLDNNLIQSTSSWPFVEIRKLLKDRKDLIKANHSYNSQQIEWFKEGSALNLIKKQNAA